MARTVQMGGGLFLPLEWPLPVGVAGGRLDKIGLGNRHLSRFRYVFRYRLRLLPLNYVGLQQKEAQRQPYSRYGTRVM